MTEVVESQTVYPVAWETAVQVTVIVSALVGPAGLAGAAVPEWDPISAMPTTRTMRRLPKHLSGQLWSCGTPATARVSRANSAIAADLLWTPNLR